MSFQVTADYIYIIGQMFTFNTRRDEHPNSQPQNLASRN